MEAAPTGFFYGNLDLPDKRLILILVTIYTIIPAAFSTAFRKAGFYL